MTAIDRIPWDQGRGYSLGDQSYPCRGSQMHVPPIHVPKDKGNSQDKHPASGIVGKSMSDAVKQEIRAPSSKALFLAWARGMPPSLWSSHRGFCGSTSVCASKGPTRQAQVRRQFRFSIFGTIKGRLSRAHSVVSCVQSNPMDRPQGKPEQKR